MSDKNYIRGQRSTYLSIKHVSNDGDELSDKLKKYWNVIYNISGSEISTIFNFWGKIK
jgi:hypothetical protein